MSIHLALAIAALAPSEIFTNAMPVPGSTEELESSWTESDWAGLAAEFAGPSATASRATDPIYVDESAWYLRLSGGLVTTESTDGPAEEIDFDEGILLTLAFGHHFGAQEDRVGFDLELEAGWSDQDTSGDISSVRDYNSVALMLNGILDLRIYQRLFFYLGAGLGAAFVDVGTASDALNDFDSEDGPFLAWQGKAGFLYRFNERVSANLGYRLVNINDIEIIDEVGTNNFDLATEQHVLEIGIGFSF